MDWEMILLGLRLRITINLENNTAAKAQSKPSPHKSAWGFHTWLHCGREGPLIKKFWARQPATLLYSKSVNHFLLFHEEVQLLHVAISEGSDFFNCKSTVASLTCFLVQIPLCCCSPTTPRRLKLKKLSCTCFKSSGIIHYLATDCRAHRTTARIYLWQRF